MTRPVSDVRYEQTIWLFRGFVPDGVAAACLRA